MYELGSDIVCAFDEVGLKKAGSGDDAEKMIMYGWASAPSLDDDGERIIQEGLNVKPLLKKGVINWNHRQDPDGIIGVPLLAELRNRSNFGKCLYTELELIATRPMAKPVWKLADDFQKADLNRTLGMSLEGKVRARTPKGTVQKADVFNIALTMNPKNDDAPVKALMKGMILGDEAEVSAEMFQPSRDHDLSRNLLTAFTDVLTKALGPGASVGGKTQTDGAALRREGMDTGGPVLIPFNTEAELERFAGGSEDLKKICRSFGTIAEGNKGGLTKAEAALYMGLVVGEPARCAALFGLL